MAAYAVGKPPPPTLHWQHRRSETVKLIALMAALLLVGGLVVASVRVQGVTRVCWARHPRSRMIEGLLLTSAPSLGRSDVGVR